jgi:hypothetical protein
MLPLDEIQPPTSPKELGARMRMRQAAFISYFYRVRAALFEVSNSIKLTRF